MKVRYAPRASWAYYELLDKEPRYQLLPHWRRWAYPHPHPDYPPKTPLRSIF